MRSEAEFDALRDAWSALLAESDTATVFMSHEWLFAWWSAYRPQAELAIVVAEDRGRVRGIAPLMIGISGRVGVTARVLRFIGDGTGETDHSETDHIAFVTSPFDCAESVPALLAAIEELDWDVAEFNQVPEGSPTAHELLQWVERMRLRPEVETKACPVRHLPASYEELLAGLPSRLRTSIRSSRRKLAQAHRVEFGMHVRQEELGDALRSFFDNHESRWQGKGIEGAFSNPKRRDFYERLTPRLLERGWLRFFYLKLDGRPVAQQYCFALDGTVMLLQEGFDFARAQDNVGNVLRSHVFEHLIESGRHLLRLPRRMVAPQAELERRHGQRPLHPLRSPVWKGWLFFALPLWTQRAKDALRPWRDRLFAHRPVPHG